MKALLKIPALVLLFVSVSGPCFALRSIGLISKERAKELGMEVRMKGNGPQVWVELEFKTEGEFKDFQKVELGVSEGEKFLLGYAPLREERTASGSILVRFLADRAYLDKLTLCIVAGLDAGYDLKLKDFVQPPEK